MGKLRLDLDSIRVETFATAKGEKPAGTVRGLVDTYPQCTIDLDCYTCDPRFYACTGGNPCTEAAACTYNGCSGW